MKLIYRFCNTMQSLRFVGIFPKIIFSHVLFYFEPKPNRWLHLFFIFLNNDFNFLEKLLMVIFRFGQNEFSIRPSFRWIYHSSYRVLRTRFSTKPLCYHNLKSLEISNHERLGDFFFLNEISYLNLARLISREIIAHLCPYHTDVLRLDGSDILLGRLPCTNCQA